MSGEHGAKKIVWERRFNRQDQRPARADARVLTFAADVIVARPRSGDAAFPTLATRPWADRAAMANPARARFDRRHRGHRTCAGCFFAGTKSFPNPARPRSASSDRAA